MIFVYSNLVIVVHSSFNQIFNLVMYLILILMLKKPFSGMLNKVYVYFLLTKSVCGTPFVCSRNHPMKIRLWSAPIQGYLSYSLLVSISILIKR